MPEKIRSILVAASHALLVATLLVRGSSSIAAPAQDVQPLRIESSTPAACPTRPSLFERVYAHTRRIREADKTESAREVRVTVVARDGGFIADLWLSDAVDTEAPHNGIDTRTKATAGGSALRRRVPGKTCTEVLDAVALIVAVTVDPLAMSGRPPLEESAEDALIPESASALDASIGEGGVGDAAHARAPDPASSRTLTRPVPSPLLKASMGVTLEAYGYGEAVWGRAYWVEGALATRWRPSLRLRLAGSNTFVVEPEGRPASFRVLTATLEGCVAAATASFGNHGQGGTLRAHPCVMFAGGLIHEASAAYGPLVRVDRPFIAAGSSLQARWTLFRALSLEAAGGVLIPLVRDEFFYRPGLVAYRMPAVALVGGLGVGAYF